MDLFWLPVTLVIRTISSNGFATVNKIRDAAMAVLWEFSIRSSQSRGPARSLQGIQSNASVQ